MEVLLACAVPLYVLYRVTRSTWRRNLRYVEEVRAVLLEQQAEEDYAEALIAFHREEHKPRGKVVDTTAKDFPF